MTPHAGADIISKEYQYLFYTVLTVSAYYTCFFRSAQGRFGACFPRRPPLKQIVCLSNEPWSPSPGRTQQLVARLKDVQVLYLSLIHI